MYMQKNGKSSEDRQTVPLFRSINTSIGNQHMQLIERLPYALCRFHTCSCILHSDVRFMMRIECASNMVSHVRQNVCDFHYLRENIYIFSTCKKKQYYYSRNLCQLKTPCHRCEALRACDAHLMGIKYTCEGGIHRFTMYLKRIIRKRNTVEQHQVVSLRSQIVGVQT